MKVQEVESSENPAPAEVVKNEPPVEADVDQGGDSAPADENNEDASAAAAVDDSETNPAAENDSGTADQESSGAGEEENQESTDEPPEIKVADFDYLSTMLLFIIEMHEIKASCSYVYTVLFNLWLLVCSSKQHQQISGFPLQIKLGIASHAISSSIGNS